MKLYTILEGREYKSDADGTIDLRVALSVFYRWPPFLHILNTTTMGMTPAGGPVIQTGYWFIGSGSGSEPISLREASQEKRPAWDRGRLARTLKSGQDARGPRTSILRGFPDPPAAYDPSGFPDGR